jgi:hypothetical protein
VEAPVDPKLRAPNIEAMTDRFVGDDALRATAKAAGKLDYDLLDDLARRVAVR